MKKIIIILSLLAFVSCQRKTETDIAYDKLIRDIDSMKHSFFIPTHIDTTDIDTGADTYHDCLN